MNGAAVAAAARNARNKTKDKQLRDPHERLDALIDIPPAVFVSQIEKLDEILINQKSKRLFGTETDAEHEPERIRVRMLDGLIRKVGEKVHRSSSYRRLGATCIFFLVYVGTLFLQRDIQAAYDVESSFITSIVSRLPETGSGGYFNSGVGATGVLSSQDELYDWISSLLLTVFSDPICGDGECSQPDEFPGFGRFGCVADCGSYLSTTPLTINLETFLTSEPDGWDLANVNLLKTVPDPGFKYNIYSETMQAFLFEEDLDNSTVMVDVPDGRLSLRLYQTSVASTSVETAAIASALSATINSVSPSSQPPISLPTSRPPDLPTSSLLPFTWAHANVSAIKDRLLVGGDADAARASSETRAGVLSSRTLPETAPPGVPQIPERAAENDFFYGDVRELLSAAASWLNGLVDYCWGGDPQGQEDAYCQLNFQDADFLFRTLAGYGFSGRITMRNETVGGGQAVATLANVSFCSVFPNGAAGNVEVNRDHLKSAEVDCASSSGRRNLNPGPGRRGRRGQRHGSAMEALLRVGGLGGGENRVGGVAGVKREGLEAFGAQGAQQLLEVVKAAVREALAGEGATGRRQGRARERRRGGAGAGGASERRIRGGAGEVGRIEEEGKEAVGEGEQVGGAGGGAASRRAVWLPVPELMIDSCCEDAGPTYGNSDWMVDAQGVNGLWYSFRADIADADPDVFIAWTVDFYAHCPPHWGPDGPPALNGYAEVGEVIWVSPTQGKRDGYIAVRACSRNGTAKSSEAYKWYNLEDAPKLSFSAELSGYSNTTFAEALSAMHAAVMAVLPGIDAFAGVAADRVTVESPEVAPAGGVKVSVEALAQSSVQMDAWRRLVDDPEMATNLTGALIRAGGVGTVVLDMASSVELGGLVGYLGRGVACTTHYDCEEGFYCASWDSSLAAAPTCASCGLCTVDADDTYDGRRCPQDKCPGSGGFPACVSASILSDRFQCRDVYDFQVWKNTPETVSDELADPAFVEPPGFERTGVNSGRFAPLVQPPFAPKVRQVTPHNRLVGAIVISQRRAREGTCDRIESPSVKSFSDSAGVTCPLQELDASPFGFDPTFMPFSKVYNGKLTVASYYENDERYVVLAEDGNVSYQSPKGFFPHSYSGTAKAPKAPEDVWPGEEESFKLFFDERLTQEQSQRLLQYAIDGKFIDSKTSQMEVELVTFNSNLNIFSVVSFSFSWEVGGVVPWDYKINTVAVDLYQGSMGTLQRVLEVMVLLMIVVNVGLELKDVALEIRAFNLLVYITDPFNWVDWSHFVLMIATAVSWIIHSEQARKFKMQDAYPILADPEAEARLFATNAAEEKQFLQLVSDMHQISASMATYSTFAGMSVVLFVFRMLKGLDFQERMGLVTRTIQSAVSDLAHFFALFAIVFAGYAWVGTLLFGHQFQGMATVGSSCLTLLIFLLSLDATQFYASVICFFILLNIFLAILVDAYASVKQETAEAAGLPEELANVALHGIKRRFWPKTRFVSDQELLQKLKALRETLSSPEAIQEDIRKTLSHRRAVLLPQGVEIDNLAMAKLIGETVPEAIQRGKSIMNLKVVPEEPEDHQSLVNRATNNEAITDLMHRYGEDVSKKADQRDREVLDLVQLDNLKRTLAIFTAQSRMIKEQKGVVRLMETLAKENLPADVWEALQPGPAQDHGLYSGVLEVELVEGDGLPRMDMFRACDPYAIMFVDGVPAAEMQSSTWKRRSVHPIWKETFHWRVTKHTTTLTVTIWDKDNITKDDIIGCAYVDVSGLEIGASVEAWHGLENPKRSNKLRHSRIKLALRLAPIDMWHAQPGNGNGAVGNAKEGLGQAPVGDSESGKIAEVGPVLPVPSGSSSPLLGVAPIPPAATAEEAGGSEDSTGQEVTPLQDFARQEPVLG